MGILGAHPMRRVTLPKSQAPSRTIMRPEELATLLEDGKGGPWFALWWTAAHTGLRLAELAGLSWQNVDWRTPSLRVERALKWDHTTSQRFLGDVKAHEARRMILDPTTAEVLDRHRADRPRQGGPRPEHVFVADRRESGGPVNANARARPHVRTPGPPADDDARAAAPAR